MTIVSDDRPPDLSITSLVAPATAAGRAPNLRVEQAGQIEKMVPKRGLEPPRALAHYPLKVACLPISPLRHEVATPRHTSGMSESTPSGSVVNSCGGSPAGCSCGAAGAAAAMAVARPADPPRSRSARARSRNSGGTRRTVRPAARWRRGAPASPCATVTARPFASNVPTTSPLARPAATRSAAGPTGCAATTTRSRR